MAKDFITIVKNVNKIVNNYKYRLKDKNKNPGGLIEIPKDLKPIIVGDLHGRTDNLKSILEHGKNLKEISDGTSILILVGDILHNDQTGEMLEMESSLTSLDYLFELINKYPNKVFYLRGNHDTFDERLRKSGIAQGVEFKKLLLKKRSKEFVNEVEKFFENLPVFIIGNKYVITHAGPVRNGISRDELINIKEDQNKYMQLMWNRINEFRGNPNLNEYGEEDIKKTLEKLKMPKDTHFIVGHNPLWNTGEKSGVWQNVMGIMNHHIIYSGAGTLAPYIIIEKGKMVINFAVKKKSEVFYA